MIQVNKVSKNMELATDKQKLAMLQRCCQNVGLHGVSNTIWIWLYSIITWQGKVALLIIFQEKTWNHKNQKDKVYSCNKAALDIESCCDLYPETSSSCYELTWDTYKDQLPVQLSLSNVFRFPLLESSAYLLAK